MTSDEMQRAIIDLTKRVQSLENTSQMRERSKPHLSPPGPPLRYSALSRDTERPGVALGVDTSLGAYAPLDDDGA